MNLPVAPKSLQSFPKRACSLFLFSFSPLLVASLAFSLFIRSPSAQQSPPSFCPPTTPTRSLPCWPFCTSSTFLLAKWLSNVTVNEWLCALLVVLWSALTSWLFNSDEVSLLNARCILLQVIQSVSGLLMSTCLPFKGEGYFVKDWVKSVSALWFIKMCHPGHAPAASDRPSPSFYLPDLSPE